MEKVLGLRKERELSKTFGVVIFIVDDQKRAYVAQEKDKNEITGKTPGEYGVICETRNARESWPANMWRAIGEETNIPDDKFDFVIDFENYRVWETEFIDKVWATVIVLRCKDPNLFMELMGRGNLPEEVIPLGFLSRPEIEKLNLRPGVRNVMNKFADDIFE